MLFNLGGLVKGEWDLFIPPVPNFLLLFSETRGAKVFFFNFLWPPLLAFDLRWELSRGYLAFGRRPGVLLRWLLHQRLDSWSQEVDGDAPLSILPSFLDKTSSYFYGDLFFSFHF